MLTLGETVRWARRTYFQRVAELLQGIVERDGDREVTFDDGWLCWDGKRQLYAPIIIERARRAQCP